MISRYDRRAFLSITGGALIGSTATRTIGAVPTSKCHGLVVGHPQGSEAGRGALEDGGNAVDAIVAAALVAGVVGVSQCGIGGYGGHVTIGLPNGKVTSIDFNSEAPAAVRADIFPADSKGNIQGNANIHGWLAAGVPGTMAGLQMALDEYGTQSFAQVVQPAIQYARNGFPVYWSLDPSWTTLQRDPGSAKLFLRNGKPLQKGETFRNPELADMLEQLAHLGSVEDFYSGRIGRQIAEAFKKNAGLVTADDMASYRPLEVAPLMLEWQGHTLATAPLTAGGLTVLQTIAALKALGTDWDRLPKSSHVRTHAWLEALRIAWADRLQMFGDPQHVDVPVGRLLSEEYARGSANKIRLAIAEKRPVPLTSDNRTAGGTVHLSAVDSNGMMAALTLTHGEGFGAQVTVEGLGLLLGHGMSRFDPIPGRPNSIAPRKRPLNNMCPTIVLRDGKPVLAIGGIGGRRIPSAVFEVLLNWIGDGRSLVDAVTEPRLYTEGGLEVRAELGRPQTEVDYLKKIGYTIQTPHLCWVAAVQVDPEKSGCPMVGVSDHASQRGGSPRDAQPVVTHTD